MNSSDDDELPDIPGTRFPWMTDDGVERGSDEAGPSNAPKRYLCSLRFITMVNIIIFQANCFKHKLIRWRVT